MLENGSHRSSVARALSSLWGGSNEETNETSSTTWTYGLVRSLITTLWVYIIRLIHEIE